MKQVKEIIQWPVVAVAELVTTIFMRILFGKNSPDNGIDTPNPHDFI